jgi:hypothetical protein
LRHRPIDRAASTATVCWLMFTFVFALDAGGLRANDELEREYVPELRGDEPLPPLRDGAFTLVVIPDTQHYRGAGCKLTPRATGPVYNPHLQAQIDWILAHRETERIVFVTHVGDIVEKDRPEEWAFAKTQLDRLRGVLPFSLTVGNHDMSSKGNARLFQQAFPAASFRDDPWYLGCYTHDRPDQRVSTNNVNSAQRFSAGGLNLLHLSLECNAPDDVLAWADALLRRYPDDRAIITTHMDLGVVDKPKTNEGFIHDPQGRMRWVKIHGQRGNSGEQMWDKLYRKHPHLFLVLSGDQSRVTALRVDRAADDGHLIHALLSDYMSEPALRLMRFLPAAQRVDVLTCDVRRNTLVTSTNYVPDRDRHQFHLELPQPGAATTR